MDVILGHDPASSEYEHSIDRGYSHPEALRVASLWVTSTWDPRCSPSQGTYIASARGLAGLPIHRLTS